MNNPQLQLSRRIRSTPYTGRVEALGVSGYSVVNHTILPKGFTRSAVEDYWHLREHVQLWDVGCQRQVQIQGADAARLAQLMTPRNLSTAKAGQCLYAPVIDRDAGLLNDPIVLKLAADRYWFSIADSDLLLWAAGLATGLGLDVRIDEPDVWPLAVQGPKSERLLATVLGQAVCALALFRFIWLDFHGHAVLVARSGYSKQGGFELYPDAPATGQALWDALWRAGQQWNIAPGCPNLVERIEGGLLSYGNEMTRQNNPFECGLGQYCDTSGAVDYVGFEALSRLRETGPAQQICGVLFAGDPCPACASPWPVRVERQPVGYITSAGWSPRFKQNVALAMLQQNYRQAGQAVTVDIAGQPHRGQVSTLPFSESV